MNNLERLLSKVSYSEDHWLWTDVLTAKGYGVFYLDGNSTTAHRASYILHGGVIPARYVIDHLCRVRHCVNPKHLEAVTNSENLLRGIGPTLAKNPKQNYKNYRHAQMYKTHCKRGHEFTPDNTYTHIWQGSPRRRCRRCAVNSAAKRYTETKKKPQ